MTSRDPVPATVHCTFIPPWLAERVDGVERVALDEAVRTRRGVEARSARRTVVAGGPAAQAGIRAGTGRRRFQGTTWPTGGDVITKLGRHAIRDENDLSGALLDYEPGQDAPLTVVRDGQVRTVNVRLGDRPIQSPQG